MKNTFILELEAKVSTINSYEEEFNYLIKIHNIDQIQIKKLVSKIKKLINKKNKFSLFLDSGII